MSDIVPEIKRAKKASITMASLPTATKDAALGVMAAALDSGRAAILEANARDMAEGERMLAAGEISQSMLKRLKIDDSKIDGMISGIRDVIGLADPVGEQMSALELDDGLVLYQMRCPIGMLGVIFESRPDVVPQIMSLCLKSGNSVAFKGGREAANSIRALFDILRDAAASAGVPADAFVLMESREDIAAILELDAYIDLLIPRGSNQFVQYIQSNTRIPVLGHAAGICHVYVDSSADQSMAVDLTVDSKTQYPAVCNAAETLLVDKAIAGEFLPKVAEALRAKNVEIRGSEDVRRIIDCVPATEEDWDTEYGDLVISVRLVDSVRDAAAFINEHGSHHTDMIVAKDMGRAAEFAALVDSAGVYVNASTRFADGYRYGKGAEVGISTNKIHARGPVGMEGLMIYKYVLVGNGQVVKDYVGPDARAFTHVPSKSRYPFGGRRMRDGLTSEPDRVVVKIGSSSIMRNGSRVSRDFMDSIAEQVRALKDSGKEVLIVSSGAIALGLKAMDVVPKPNEIPIRQAAASVGQGILMKEWGDSFQRFGMSVGQILLTMDTYSDRESVINLHNTVNSLLEHGVVPIFNENDAIRTQEIRFGDNDTLSAIIASRTDADMLVILSDIDGLYDSDPRRNPGAKLVPLVTDIDSVASFAGDVGSSVGTGGMKTKIAAARICNDSGCDMVIAASAAEGAVLKAATGQEIGTLFVSGTEISKKRRWIKSAHASGTITVDLGAEKAINSHKSLLPIGIKDVSGTFSKGDVVDIVCEGRAIAKGIVSYSSSDLRAIAGKHSDEIEKVLGYKTHDDAIISENLAVLRWPLDRIPASGPPCSEAPPTASWARTRHTAPEPRRTAATPSSTSP